MQAILNSDKHKPLMHVSALAGMGKSMVLGLLMRLSVIMAKQAGLAAARGWCGRARLVAWAPA